MPLPALGAFVARAAIGKAVRSALFGGGSARGVVSMPTKVTAEVEGIEQIEEAFRQLAGPQQRSVMRSALRKSGKRIKGRIETNLGGAVVKVQTGNLREAFRSAEIVSKARKGRVVVGIAPPTRAELGISADDTSYFPYAIEYGHVRAPAHPYIRPAVDEDIDGERRRIREDVGKGIDRLFRVKRRRK